MDIQGREIEQPLDEGMVDAIELLNISPVEANYLRAWAAVDNAENPQVRESAHTRLVKAATEFRITTGGSKENMMRPDVTNRMMGLQWAYEDVRRIAGNQELSGQPNFNQEIIKFAAGLVDKRTQEYADFRDHVTSSPAQNVQ